MAKYEIFPPVDHPQNLAVIFANGVTAGIMFGWQDDVLEAGLSLDITGTKIA